MGKTRKSKVKKRPTYSPWGLARIIDGIELFTTLPDNVVSTHYIVAADLLRAALVEIEAAKDRGVALWGKKSALRAARAPVPRGEFWPHISTKRCLGVLAGRVKKLTLREIAAMVVVVGDTPKLWGALAPGARKAYQEATR